jgi:MinD superfamily P-loop ATPase
MTISIAGGKGGAIHMKELVVISGKGGTGKTSLLAGFASLANNKVLCDADVDAADLHLIMAPGGERTPRFSIWTYSHY